MHAEYAAIASRSFEYAEPPEPLALVKAAASRLRATAAESLLWQGFDWGEGLQPRPVRELRGKP